jgi:hypothetical protein
VDTFEQARAPSLRTILATCFANGTCSQREIERVAALHGHTALSVETALARAERDGLLVREVVFRVVPEAMADTPILPHEPVPTVRPAPSKPTDLAIKMQCRSRKGDFWPHVLKKLLKMGTGDASDLHRDDWDLKEFATHLAVQIYQWRRDGKLEGRYTTRTVTVRRCVHVTRTR